MNTAPILPTDSAANASSAQTPPPPLTLTARAAARIRSLAPADAKVAGLRIRVDGGGCSGFQYVFDLVAAADPDDMVIELDGARVLVDPVSMPFLAGSQLDFVDDLMGASFRIRNPNATASCGCGTSFSV